MSKTVRNHDFNSRICGSYEQLLQHLIKQSMRYSKIPQAYALDYIKFSQNSSHLTVLKKFATFVSLTQGAAQRDFNVTIPLSIVLCKIVLPHMHTSFRGRFLDAAQRDFNVTIPLSIVLCKIVLPHMHTSLRGLFFLVLYLFLLVAHTDQSLLNSL